MTKTLLQLLIDEAASEVNLLQKQIEKGEYHQAQRLSHKLKTTFPFVGNQQLINDNTSLELLLKDPSDIPRIQTLSQAVHSIWNSCLPEIQNELKSYTLDKLS